MNDLITLPNDLKTLWVKYLRRRRSKGIAGDERFSFLSGWGRFLGIVDGFIEKVIESVDRSPLI